MRELKPMFDELITNPKLSAFILACFNFFNWANFDALITRIIAILSVVAIIYSIRLSRKRSNQIDALNRDNDSSSKLDNKGK